MELSKAQITGVVALVMILSGVVIVTNIGDTYYCATEDSVRECYRLSSTNATCYYIGLDGNLSDLCTKGKWQPIGKYANFNATPPTALINVEEKEAPAKIAINEFSQYPLLIDYSIISIRSDVDKQYVIFEWEFRANNTRDNRTDAVNGYITIQKSEINNQTLIRQKLRDDVLFSFQRYRNGFKPSIVVNYNEHPLYGKKYIS